MIHVSQIGSLWPSAIPPRPTRDSPLCTLKISQLYSRHRWPAHTADSRLLARDCIFASRSREGKMHTVPPDKAVQTYTCSQLATARALSRLHEHTMHTTQCAHIGALTNSPASVARSHFVTVAEKQETTLLEAPCLCRAHTFPRLKACCNGPRPVIRVPRITAQSRGPGSRVAPRACPGD